MKEAKIFNYFDLISFLKPSSPVSTEILDFIPTMKPRLYSLSSDPIDTKQLEICLTIEEYEQNNVFAKDHTIIK